MNKVKIKYTSVAVPPDGIVVKSEYSLEKDSKGYFVTNSSGKLYMSIEMFKNLFSPVNSTWEKVFPVEKKVEKK